MVTTLYNHMRDFLLPYARHYRSLGWRVDALAQRDDTYDECAAGFDRVYEIGWSRNPGELRDVPGLIRTVAAIEASEGYDIVHVHTPIAAFLTRTALRRARARGGPAVVYTAHGFHYHPGGSRLKNAAYLGLERIAGRWTDHLVVINRADERAALRHRLVPPDRLHYTPGIGIDIRRYDPDAVGADEVERVRRGLGMGPADRLFLMVAEFTVNKRHADAVTAFARLDRPGVHLAIAGREGPTLEPTRRLVQRLGVGGRVHLLGFRNDIPALIRASTGTLLVSAREGLPRSVLESLCMGVPVVGTRIRGIADLLEPGGGRLVDVGDIEAIRAGLAWMLDHPEEARDCGKEGRRNVGGYDLRHVVALHDDIYAHALEDAQPGRWPSELVAPGDHEHGLGPAHLRHNRADIVGEQVDQGPDAGRGVPAEPAAERTREPGAPADGAVP